MMVIWIVVGSGVGWLAARVRGNHHLGVPINVIYGVSGALLGGWLLGPLLGSETSGGAWPTVAAAGLGTLGLLAGINVLHRAIEREE